MATKIFNIDGKRVVFGLEWNALSSDDEANEIKTLVKDSGAAYQIRFDNDHSVVIGFLPADDIKEKETKKTTYVSVAMLLASHKTVEPYSIWFEVHKDEAHIAVLENGSPTPAGDFYGSVEAAHKIIERIQADSTEKFTFYGRDSALFSDDYVPLTLEDLLHQGDIGKATLTPVKGKTNQKLVLGALIAAIAIGGYMYSEYSKNIERQKFIEMKQKQAKSDSATMYKQALQNALITAGVPSSSVAKEFLSKIKAQELQLEGWALDTIDCNAESCKYTWKSKGGNNKNLTRILGDQAYEFSPNGSELKYSIPVKSSDIARIDYSKLPKYKDFMIETGSFAQNVSLLGGSFTLAAPAIFAAEPGIAVTTLKSPVKFGKVTINTKLALLPEILQGLPDSMAFKKLQIVTGAETPTFMLEGNYYVKD